MVAVQTEADGQTTHPLGLYVTSYEAFLSVSGAGVFTQDRVLTLGTTVALKGQRG